PVLALLGLGFLALMPAIATVGSVLFTFGKGILDVITKVDDLASRSGAIGAFFTKIKTAASGVGKWISRVFSGIWTSITTVFSRMSGAAGTAAGKVGGVLGTLASNVRLIFQGLMIELGAIFGPIGASI